MTAMSPEQVIPETVDLTSHEFEVICDIAGLMAPGKGFPACKGDPARWVGWKNHECSPKYRLLCSHCKDVYRKWQAFDAAITCSSCGEMAGGFATYTPLKGVA